MKTMKRLLALLVFAAAAFAQGGHSVTLSWIDTQNPSGTTYNAWRAAGACPAMPPTTTAGFTQLNAAAIAAKTYIDSAVSAGNTYCYVVTAVSVNGQSAPSNAVGGTIPAAFPVTMLSIVVQ